MKNFAFMGKMAGVLVAFSLLLFTLRGSAYPMPDDYQSRTASDKMSYLWQRVVEEAWPSLPPYSGRGWGSLLRSFGSFFHLKKTFDHTSDELPEGRVKIIHTYGSVVQLALKPEPGHPFTGLYKKGGMALARLSLAANPDKIGFIPGMALKFLIDAKPSRNIMVMNSLEGQGDNRNFFAKVFSNAIPAPSFFSFNLWVLFKIFSTVSNPANIIPVQSLASVHQDGSIPERIQSPTRLNLKPSEEVEKVFDGSPEKDLRVSLTNIPKGTILYELFGILQGKEYKIGELRTASEFVNSSYGDKKLFFQHPRS